MTPARPSDQELGGMTVNERLVACGLLDAWDDAARDRNLEQMIALLIETAIPREQAERTTEAVLKNPEMYGSDAISYACFDELIASLRRDGLSTEADRLHVLLHGVAWPTSSELLGELGQELKKIE